MVNLGDRVLVCGGFFGVIALIAFICAAAYGWVMNIVTLIGLDFSTVTAEIVLRVIGVFMVPVGCVAGWI